jgi:hypothetical protein
MRNSLARRFVVYIRALGAEPVEPADDNCKTYTRRLEEQYVVLKRKLGELETKRAREAVRTAIRTLGLRAAATPFPTLSPKTPSLLKKDRKPTSAQRQIVHICPVCRARSGLGKMSWKTQMWAEAERSRAKERGVDLQVYECPYKPGTWHLTHRRPSRKKRTPAQG